MKNKILNFIFMYFSDKKVVNHIIKSDLGGEKNKNENNNFGGDNINDDEESITQQDTPKPETKFRYYLILRIEDI